MAIKSSGQLSFTEIVAEFPDTAPHSMSEFYRGGGKVPDANVNIPTSGAISFSNFYGATNRVTVQLTISSNQQNYTLSPNLFAGYSAGITDAIVYINEGVYIWSSSNTLGALTVSGWNSNDTVKIINKGFILGKGGDGGNAVRAAQSQSQSGTAGGPAIKVIGTNLIAVDTSWPTAYVAGGGGGGASSFYGTFSGGGGGAGGGKGGDVVETNNTAFNKTGGAGGAIGAVGSAGAGDNDLYNAGAGGGRIVPGVGGIASLSTTDGLSRAGGAGGTGSWSDGRNYSAQQGTAGGAGGGWGGLGSPGWIMLTYQLSQYMPSYGNGGSAGAIPAGPEAGNGGYPAGIAVDLSTGAVTITRPSTYMYPNQFGGIFGFSGGGYAVQTQGGPFQILLSNSSGRPGGFYAGFYGSIGV